MTREWLCLEPRRSLNAPFKTMVERKKLKEVETHSHHEINTKILIIRAVLETVEVTALGLKNSYAYAFWSWSKACIDYESSSEIDFYCLWVLYRVCIGLC